MSTFRNTKGQYETILPCAKCGSFFVCLYYGNPYNGEPTTVLAHCADCGADGPHITRHTCATWLMQSGVDINEAASYLGMSPETLWNTYGHHSPAMMGNAARAEGRRIQAGDVAFTGRKRGR